jgi:hypothetical protein
LAACTPEAAERRRAVMIVLTEIISSKKV